MVTSCVLPAMCRNEWRDAILSGCEQIWPIAPVIIAQLAITFVDRFAYDNVHISLRMGYVPCHSDEMPTMHNRQNDTPSAISGRGNRQ